MISHLYELVRQRAAEYPTAAAIGGQEGLVWKTLDSCELLDLVDRLAAELAAKGVSEGDRVVTWLPNHWRTPVYLFALWKLGAIIVPFDREMNPEAGATIIESVQPQMILAGYGERPAWAQDQQVVEWWEPGSEVRAPASDWTKPTEELAAAVFTSGTTGAPKGCMLTHANICSQVDPLADSMPLDPSCRLASVLPLSHMFELTCGLLYPLSTGAAIHYVPSRRGPDIVRVLNEQRVTHMMCVPQLLVLMGQALDDQLRKALPGVVLDRMKALAQHLPLDARRGLFWMVHRKLGGHLRVMVSGGAALAPETQRFWEELGVRVVQGYGASECSPVIACGTWEGKAPIGSVGHPLRGVELQLSAEGELLVNGPNVMRGYWKDPAKTADVLKDGWYATGDLARIDVDGNVWIQGRARDLIVLPSGLNLWPQDVEDVLREHPAVRDAALISVPTGAGGASLHAYLIPDGAPVEISGIIASCNARLAQHQRVATASWWPEADFPRTSTLKLRRNMLPQPEAAATVQVHGALAADDPVGQAVAGVARTLAVQSSQTLAELGLDSLGLVELAVAIEAKTGQSVAEGDLRLDMTVQQVRDAVVTGAGTVQGREGEAERVLGEQPMWPYTWGRVFRGLALPADLLYRRAVTKTFLIGGGNLTGLAAPVIFAGTHHGFLDMSLVRQAIAGSPARHLARQLVPAAAAVGLAAGGLRIRGFGLWPWYVILAFGLFPLQRERGQEASLRRLVQIGRLGNPILIFPQGAHVRPSQERNNDPSVRFRPGVAHLAEALDASVVPFGLAGTDIVLPPTTEGFEGKVVAGIPVSYRRGPLAIAFGAPIRRGADEPAEAFTERLQVESYRLTRLAEQGLAPADGHNAS